MNKAKSALLSNEFKVAAQIFEYNEAKKNIWFSKLAELLKDDMSSTTVINSLRGLIQWGIVRAEYGPTDKGRAGRLLYIAGESRTTIKEVYENFWKE